MPSTPLSAIQRGDRLNRAEEALLHGRIGRRAFLRLSASLGVSAAAAGAMALHGEAVAQNQAARRADLQAQYDYIVVGSGSSGSVVASRLSEKADATVLLLEAGGTDQVENIQNPGMWPTNLGSERDWGFRTTPQAGLNGRAIPFSMGRAFGGGSSINVMAYVRGHKADYDLWAEAAGDERWSYAHALEIFKRVEDFHGPADPAYRGQGGIVHSQIAENPTPIAPAMVAAGDGVGIPAHEDHNAAMMEGEGGIALANQAIKDGRRRNMPSHYLHPVMNRPNLTVLTGAQATRVVIEGGRAVAVEVAVDGAPMRFEAGAEIVLSGGAVNTPKLLMLSGVGPAEELRALGIDVAVDLPGVGRGFHDHPLLGGCVWEYRRPEAPRNSGANCTFWWKSRSDLPSPDLQPYQLDFPYASEVTAQQFEMPEHGWSIAVGLDQPQSRGTVRLASADWRDEPILDPRFLSEQADVDALKVAVELCREIGNAPEMAEFVKREVMPGPLKGAALETFIRNACNTYWHQVGSCRMGRDAMAVVDGTLKVYGVEGLRVADGSIMPRIATGNTMVPCMLIGERMAEILA